MPLEDLNQIDLITHSNADGKIGLIITDAGITTDPEERLALLKQKLAVYLHGLAQGQVSVQDRTLGPQDCFIEVLCATKPTQEMFCISKISLENSEATAVTVKFTPFPEGAWEPDAPPTESDQDTASLSPELQELARLAFEAAHETMLGNSIPLFLLFVENGDKKLAQIQGKNSTEELLDSLRAWGNKSTAVTHCALIGAGALENQGQNETCLIARICQRGAATGFIMVQTIETVDGKPTPAHAPQIVDQCENFLR